MQDFSASQSRPELSASLSRPRLDATLVLENASESDGGGPQQLHTHPLFALASLNTRTAASAEVRWDQLLALSLAPEDDPVLSVGRHRDCSVQLADPRASLRHFEIVVRRKREDRGNAAADVLEYECFLRDCSSNGTSVNCVIVGKGNSRQLRSGDEICVLPASKVGSDEMVGFLFRNTTEAMQAPEEVQQLELDELVLCPICMQAIYKCVALAPCSHNFCMSCCSDWMRRKNECPVCRRPIAAVMKNHPMDNVIEAFLGANPHRRRSSEEIRDMDLRDELRLGSSGKLVRDICYVDVSMNQTLGGPGTLGRPRTARPVAPAGASSASAVAEVAAAAASGGAAVAAATPSGSSAAAPAGSRSAPAERPTSQARLGSQVCALQ
mmetsp:Transcript_97306/g.208789  ORF Transcript_97306/g.208789 Transcript_97306/m.208789 type:complete len:382 (-) Transcript_97306:123-1268(-)